MNSQSLQQPLNDDELDRLGEFLDEIDPPAMNLEMLDGYFAALVCCPDRVMPSEYLPQIWGNAFSFDSDDQAADIIGLIMRHWNTISSALSRTLRKDDVYMPILLLDEDGVAYGNDWATGFMHGVQARPASWGKLLNSVEYGGPMVIIMLLAHEHDPDPDMRPPPIAPDKREDLLQMMIAGLTHIYRYFEPLRSPEAQHPMCRQAQKIGRNALCPCGSGRKYKHCCGEATPTLH